MTLRINIGKRTKKRQSADGREYRQIRFVVDYISPKTGKRQQRFFKTKAEATEHRNKIIAEVETGTWMDRSIAPTLGQLVDDWFADRESVLRARTIKGYERIATHIKGPLLIGADADAKRQFSMTGEQPEGASMVAGLAEIKVADLTTRQIREWHRNLSESVSVYAANRAKTALRTILELGAEDYHFRPPAMPRSLSKCPPRPKKTILTEAEVRQLLEWAMNDARRGIYCAFPFLTGVRIGEQLGLLWDDVDFDKNILVIRHTQDIDGAIVEATKTQASTREIPMHSMLRVMLLDWKVRCPRKDGELYRVFPGPGRLQKWPKPRLDGGGPLLYPNFRLRYWKPGLEAAGVPFVTPHSARHYFISTLQAKGVEVGLVAQLAGHADPSITLGRYTQAVRVGSSAIAKLI